MNFLKNGSLIFFSMLFVFGQAPQNDFAGFETYFHHCEDDMGSIDACTDPGLPQLAALSSYNNVHNAAQMNLTKNVRINQSGFMTVRYNSAIVSIIKEYIVFDTKTDIPLKLRI